MVELNYEKPLSGVFITFSGNCKKALSFYQSCFGGILQFETFEPDVLGFTEKPVVSGSLVSDHILIHGSDLVHNEGRKTGNYLSIFLQCKNSQSRKALVEKLGADQKEIFSIHHDDQQLVEITDAFEVRWILAI